MLEKLKNAYSKVSSVYDSGVSYVESYPSAALWTIIGLLIVVIVF